MRRLLFPSKNHTPSIPIYFVVLSLFAMAGTVSAYIEAIHITPENPASDDVITISMSGWFPDACWGPGPTGISQDGNTIEISIIGVDAWQPDHGCLTVIIPYEFSFDVGPLAAGTYTVIGAEYHQSPRLPYPFYLSKTLIVGCAGSECGDANCDMQINIGDAVYILNYIFRGGPPPVPIEAGNVNGDESVNIGDAVYLVNFIFRNGPPPVNQ